MLFNRRIGSIWIGALLLVVFAMGANGAAQSQSPTSLEGTFWAGTDSDGSPFVFEFQPSGKFRYVPATDVVSKGTWKQLGASIEMDVNGRFVRFSGTHDKGVLSGEALSKRGARWNWNATKQPGVFSKVAPRYPAIAAAARASGNVIVEMTIRADGAVVSARAISGFPLLRQVSVVAGRLWKFVPVVQSDEVRLARVVFSFRIPVNVRQAKKSSNPIFASPYQVVITPPHTIDQVNYSTAQAN